MNRHPIDVLSFVFGVITVIAGIAAVNNRLGNVVNDRPDALVPTIVLLVGVLLVVAAVRRVPRREPVDQPAGQITEPDES